MEILVTIKCTGGNVTDAAEFLSAIKDFDCKIIIEVDSVPSIGKIDWHNG